MKIEHRWVPSRSRGFSTLEYRLDDGPWLMGPDFWKQDEKAMLEWLDWRSQQTEESLARIREQDLDRLEQMRRWGTE